ncbi:MAG: hypothetical protein JWP74_1544 [Marmoricola sp.]|nr:hypothetical protein [Marmoricola sp.]
MLRPKYWGGHLAVLLCIAAAAGLGLWQLDAWHIHRVDAARDISARAPVALDKVMGGDSTFPGRSVGQQVTFHGTWVGSSTLYVSDRYFGSKHGYWVMTPVLVDGTKSAMPLVRGWSPTHTSTIPTGAVTITGWLQPTEGLGSFDSTPDNDVIPMMRIASIVQHVPDDLYSGFVIAHVSKSDLGPSQAGLTSIDGAVDPDVSGFTGLRNFLYAIEWWFFGGFAIFVWYRWCVDTYQLDTAAPVEDDEDAEKNEEIPEDVDA